MSSNDDKTEYVLVDGADGETRIEQYEHNLEVTDGIVQECGMFFSAIFLSLYSLAAILNSSQDVKADDRSIPTTKTVEENARTITAHPALVPVDNFKETKMDLFNPPLTTIDYPTAMAMPRASSLD